MGEFSRGLEVLEKGAGKVRGGNTLLSVQRHWVFCLSVGRGLKCQFVGGFFSDLVTENHQFTPL